MLDHIGVAVSNYEKSKRFYAAGLGIDGRPDFWLSQGASVAPA